MSGSINIKMDLKSIHESANELETRWTLTADLKVAHDAVTRLVRVLNRATSVDKDYEYALEFSQMLKEANDLIDSIEHTLRVHKQKLEQS